MFPSSRVRLLRVSSFRAFACGLLAFGLAASSLPGALLVPSGLRDVPAPSTAWRWPAPPPRSVTRAFEAPASAYGAGHRGIDLFARPGAPIFAPADGVVSFSGVVAGRPVLSVSHPGDLISSVEPVLGMVAGGDRVVAGQVVGRLASGGHCVSDCLHFGVRLHGQYVSPMLFFGGIPRAILLPLHSSQSRETAVVRAKTAE